MDLFNLFKTLNLIWALPKWILTFKTLDNIRGCYNYLSHCVFLTVVITKITLMKIEL